MKTAELTGAALDWAVAKCEGILDANDPMQFVSNRSVGMFYYSSKWAQGGAIIENQSISVSRTTMRPSYAWEASQIFEENISISAHGETPLIAAMRCYVASKLGDEIEIPAELEGK